MDEQRRPRGREAGEPHALRERRGERAAAGLAAMLVVTDERRVADHCVHPWHLRFELRRRGLSEEVALDQRRLGALLSQQGTRLVQRPGVDVDAIQLIGDLARIGARLPEVLRRRQEEDTLARGWVQDPGIGASSKGPARRELGNLVGREERPALLA